MIARSFFGRAALVAALVLTAGHPVAFAQDADAVFSRLLTKYRSIDALRAEFTQTMSSAYWDQEESFSGVLILQGEKYRVETGTEVFVVNGQETYIYRPAEEQVLIDDIAADESSFSPSDFLLHYDERFDVIDMDVVAHEGERHFRINLKPKNAESFFREATIWMRDRDEIITQMTLLDVNDTRMVFTLDNIEINPALDEDTFRFTPPEGVEIIDLRS